LFYTVLFYTVLFCTVCSARPAKAHLTGYNLRLGG